MRFVAVRQNRMFSKSQQRFVWKYSGLIWRICQGWISRNCLTFVHTRDDGGCKSWFFFKSLRMNITNEALPPPPPRGSLFSLVWILKCPLSLFYQYVMPAVKNWNRIVEKLSFVAISVFVLSLLFGPFCLSELILEGFQECILKAKVIINL